MEWIESSAILQEPQEQVPALQCYTASELLMITCQLLGHHASSLYATPCSRGATQRPLMQETLDAAKMLLKWGKHSV
ncbi:hypothetical protein PBY51_013841 [Eleginops maclovinus]|uniref:Uncharacterized protein n=1 Tax=Eleginops maclovinus TaxID=56733 RepID=A0AAN7Y6X3_ELEMC|nr:hypothetical protein PBY51_013841 [Eleginops maclovinus]